MKKIFIKTITVFFIILSMASVPVYASEDTYKSEKKPILDIIEEQKDVSKTDNIYKKQYYDEKLQDCDFSDDIIMKVYYEPMWEFAGEEIEEIVSEIGDKLISGYVVFEDKPIRIWEYKKDDKIRIDFVERYEECPTYLSDIVNSSIYDSKIKSAEREYSKVICFDGTNSMQGVVVYYLNGENSVVYYYETYSSSPLEFTLQDFQIYGTAYNEYLISDENNYSQNGMFLGGGTKTFATFVEQVDIQDYVQNDNPITKRAYMLFVGILLFFILICVYVVKVRLYNTEK